MYSFGAFFATECRKVNVAILDPVLVMGHKYYDFNLAKLSRIFFTYCKLMISDIL